MTEIGEMVAVPVPKPAPKAPPKSKFEGVIKGPAGPLKDWPFLLEKNGQAIDKGGLGGGTRTGSSPFRPAGPRAGPPRRERA